MNKFRNLILVLAVLFFANACAEPDDATPTQMVIGEWMVENVIANGQVNLPDQALNLESKLYLDYNESFMFVNINGLGDAGTWTATEDALTLSGREGDHTYDIIFVDWDKLHIHRSFSIGAGGEVELRYMLRRVAP